MPFVYILRSSDKSFYVGHTDTLTSYEHAHNEGYTRKLLSLSVTPIDYSCRSNLLEIGSKHKCGMNRTTSGETTMR